MFSSPLEQMQYPFGMGRAMPAGHRPWKPSVEMAPNCPRCDSANTKFCYYNNYSLTQPRYFCKGCRRYWTKGGSLRNVPVGGGCRKNRHRGKSSAARSLLSSRGLISSTTATSEIDNYHSRRQITTNCTQLRPDLALDDMVGSSHHQSSMVASLLPDDDQSSSSRDASSTIDLAALYSKFLNQGQFVPEQLADGPCRESYELGGAGSEGEMGDQLGYDPFDVATGGYESSLGMPDHSTSISPAEVLFLWQPQVDQLQPPGLCPFPGMGCDWSSLDHLTFGAF